MKKVIIYIHGKGGSIEEAKHYESLFKGFDVIGFDYKAETPWEAMNEFKLYYQEISKTYDYVCIIANSIGAYFALNALGNEQIEKAYLISPIVNMEQLIMDMMSWANVNEDSLKEKGTIKTTFGEILSWDYLIWARSHPIQWNIPTHIVYGSKDHLQSLDTINEFVSRYKTTLTIMENGEHWFHTDEQMKFIDEWIQKI